MAAYGASALRNVFASRWLSFGFPESFVSDRHALHRGKLNLLRVGVWPLHCGGPLRFDAVELGEIFSF